MKTLEKQSPQAQVIQELSNGYIRVYEITEVLDDPDSELITIKISGNYELVKGDE